MKVSFIVPVRKDWRVTAGIRRLRQFAEAEGIDAEIITCGELINSFDAQGDRHIDVKPAVKGRCVKTGVLMSNGSIIVVIDADVPVDNRDMRRLIHEAAFYDVVLGNRFMDGAIMDESRPLARSFASLGFRIITRQVFGMRGIDTQCGAKALRAASARILFASQVASGFAYDVEVVLRARASGMSVFQVPVTWVNGESTISLWRTIPPILIDLLRLIRSFCWSQKQCKGFRQPING